MFKTEVGSNLKGQAVIIKKKVNISTYNNIFFVILTFKIHV